MVLAVDQIPTARKRGRPALTEAQRAANAARKGAQKAGLAVAPSKLAVDKVVGVHHMLSHVTGGLVPQINQDQGRALVEAFGSLSAHYGVAISGPTVLWINVIATCAAIYGPNAVMVMQARMQQAKDRRAARNRGETVASVVMPDGTAAVVNLDGTPHIGDVVGNPNDGQSPGGITLG